MEIFIVIVIVGLATAYIIKTFYNKYKIGKASGPDCGCTSCDSNDPARSRLANTKPDDCLICK
ncbi:MAG: FeoB-associated Cys-rich membrane protein [Desulfobacterales bacterium]|uniref:FeoB-associated Cys-rich membrane protein n=1 Tax=Candidatus Desulfatibia profunda TaxID=2841695 RepID=A0A8J6NMX7_9BACT|nr:FeoB-associated Cys-rich membrane protein [Candidatus Desulfatibia profunda]MBL7178780.1 FeoB-associated Cys-rich membrane protein [Desulfobacterales bacterium]